jgi:hypothetical protein
VPFWIVHALRKKATVESSRAHDGRWVIRVHERTDRAHGQDVPAEEWCICARHRADRVHR